MQTGYKVMDAMTKRPIMISKEKTISECAQEMAKHSIGSLLIVEGKKIIGIMTDTDIVRKVVSVGMDPTKFKAEDIMVRSFISIEPEKDIYDALVKMNESGIRQLPVVQNREILGLLTLKDILKIEPALFELIVENLEIREEENKPVGMAKTVCQTCGEIVQKVYDVDGISMCLECKSETDDM